MIEILPGMGVLHEDLCHKHTGLQLWLTSINKRSADNGSEDLAPLTELVRSSLHLVVMLTRYCSQASRSITQHLACASTTPMIVYIDYWFLSAHNLRMIRMEV